MIEKKSCITRKRYMNDYDFDLPVILNLEGSA